MVPSASRSGPGPSTFRLLDHTFRIASDQPPLLVHVQWLYASAACDQPPAVEYGLWQRDSGFVVTVDDEPLTAPIDAQTAGAMLFWVINRDTIARNTSFVLLHAAAVHRDGLAVVMPAPMDAGKTTLAAALLTAGFSYLTDEATAIEPQTGRVIPYRKPLALDPSADKLFPQRLGPPAPVAPFFSRQFQVRADQLGDFSAAASHAVPRLFISPRYEAGGGAAPVPMSRARMALHVLSQCFAYGRGSDQTVGPVIRALRTSECFELRVDDLAAASRAIDRLFDKACAAAEGTTTSDAAVVTRLETGWRAYGLDDELLLVEEASGKLVHLDRTGAEILDAAIAGDSPEKIAGALGFPGQQRVHQDVARTLERLGAEGILAI